ncbi:MAG: hypothetical protein UX92_C0029G0004 [Candidatus Amesbacteria bacterium GW2011_GWA1_47_20]|uniref:NYN domain-containing protein n=1 Tax=Candidatus Amesbacteria bacterium GW2011_GWA1_47_20 TaxID=1618354 RepID=A0A0G1SE77_9BACT|nr:MAG: hypothetical protein UX92_C0029G0004 [Candidatus Amesbacteria bacterium GW2011_GWA1_47_20]
MRSKDICEAFLWYTFDMDERVVIFIDGSNFYFKLKELNLGRLLDLDLGKFAKFIARKRKIVKKCYFIGKVRQDGTPKSEKLFDGQQKLLGRLKNAGFVYKLGYLLKTGDIYHEKGVDVQIAVDMMEAAYEDLCDRIILISSDTDLAPAIAKARSKGKVVEYVGFSHKPSVAMVSFCSESTLLKKEDLEEMFVVKE